MGSLQGMQIEMSRPHVAFRIRSRGGGAQPPVISLASHNTVHVAAQDKSLGPLQELLVHVTGSPILPILPSTFPNTPTLQAKTGHTTPLLTDQSTPSAL